MRWSSFTVFQHWQHIALTAIYMAFTCSLPLVMGEESILGGYLMRCYESTHDL